MVIYFETSAINYLNDNVDRQDIITLRDALKQLDDGKSMLCLSPVTMWEIVCTGNPERREALIATCQILFEDGYVYPGPISIMDNFTAAGCPKQEKMFDFKETCGKFAEEWRKISSDLDKTIIVESELIDRDGKYSAQASRMIEKLIKSNFTVNAYPEDELYSSICEWINNVYGNLHFIKGNVSLPENSEMIYKAGIFFATSLLITGISFSFDQSDIYTFWNKREITEIGHQMRYLFCHYEAMLQYGPIFYMAMMAVKQVEGKGNRGLYKDCVHAMYMAYCDILFSNDKHFMELAKGEPVGFWGKIRSIEKFWNDIQNSVG